MTDKKVWFITGAGRGMGVDISQGRPCGRQRRRRDRTQPRGGDAPLGESDDLLARHSSTSPSPTTQQPPSEAAVDRFGRIDVLVNNAANFYAGFFEELTPEQMRAAADDEPHRPDERHPRRPARHAQAALGPRHHDLVGRGPRRLRVRYRLRRVEVRARGLDGVAAARGRAVRHPHHDRQPRILPHRAAHARVDELRRAVDRRLRRARATAASRGGRRRTASRPATRPSSRRRCSRSPTKQPPPRRFIAGADRSRPPSRRSPSCRPTSTSTASASSRSTSPSDHHAYLDPRQPRQGRERRRACHRVAAARWQPPAYVTIWIVRVDDDIYVRSGGSRQPLVPPSHGVWGGRIRAGGLEQDVALEVPRQMSLPASPLHIMRSTTATARASSGQSSRRRPSFRPCGWCHEPVSRIGRLGGRHRPSQLYPWPTRHDLALSLGSCRSGYEPVTPAA